MKKIIKIYNDSSVITKAFIRMFFIFSICVLMCSAAFYFGAEHSYSYYTARELSFELIKVLRSGSTIITAGTIITEYLENNSITSR